MIIGACGFGGTGSSSIADYLAEYDFIQVIRQTEFDWVNQPDGLIDLEYHLKHPHCRYGDSYKALDRYYQMCKNKVWTIQKLGVNSDEFLNSVNDFIESITQSEWALSFDLKPSKSLIEKIFLNIVLRSGFIRKWEKQTKCQWDKYPYRKIKYASYPKNFDNLAKQHVMAVIEKMGVDFDKPIVFDQPFSGENPQACFKYFEDPYAIVVDRDPRDLYIHGKVYLPGQFGYCIMPLNDVKHFVAFYRGLRDNQPYKENHERVLSVKLEDMIYQYDDTTNKVRDFLKLPKNPHPRSIFEPTISMGNTQLWLRYPQFEKEIKYIEQELPDYLYDFSGCPIPADDAIIFGDEAPKPNVNN